MPLGCSASEVGCGVVFMMVAVVAALILVAAVFIIFND